MTANVQRQENLNRIWAQTVARGISFCLHLSCHINMSEAESIDLDDPDKTNSVLGDLSELIGSDLDGFLHPPHWCPSDLQVHPSTASEVSNLDSASHSVVPNHSDVNLLSASNLFNNQAASPPWHHLSDHFANSAEYDQYVDRIFEALMPDSAKSTLQESRLDPEQGLGTGGDTTWLTPLQPVLTTQPADPEPDLSQPPGPSGHEPQDSNAGQVPQNPSTGSSASDDNQTPAIPVMTVEEWIEKNGKDAANQMSYTKFTFGTWNYVNSMRKPTLTENKSVTCTLCGNVFDEQTHPFHLQDHHMVKPETYVKCIKCDNLVAAESLYAHLVSVHRLSAKKVADTGLPFSIDATQYNQLNEKHKSEYSCTICKVAFDNEKKLQSHFNDLHVEVVEGASPPWEHVDCKICNLQIPKPSNQDEQTIVANHLFYAHNTKPYVCHLCNKRFFPKANLQRHLLGHHGLEIDSKTCRMCSPNKTFASTPTLYRHMVQVHQGVGNYLCIFCGIERATYEEHKSHLCKIVSE